VGGGTDDDDGAGARALRYGSGGDPRDDEDAAPERRGQSVAGPGECLVTGADVWGTILAVTLQEIQIECLKLEATLVSKVIKQAKGDMAALAVLLDCSSTCRRQRRRAR
jgi:hypothetical protein